jgi:hypothetical protein
MLEVRFAPASFKKKCGNFGKKKHKNQTVADEMSPNSPRVADFMLDGAVS